LLWVKESMPIYEYECLDCSKESGFLVLRKEDERQITCLHCGGKRLKRLISRVAYHMSEGDRLEAYDPSAPQTGDFYRDSRNIGLHAKKRAQQLGVDLGSSFETKLEKLRSNPASVLDDKG